VKVLVACEFSGVVRDAFTAKGHFAQSCDLLDTESPGWHYKGDVRDILHLGWDLMIAHPPCTRLCNSGVRWLAERNLWAEMEEAANFFRCLLDAPIAKVCVENPIMHKYAKAICGEQTQKIQPWQFGHGETKATCLWLKNLPILKPTKIVEGRDPKVHYLPPSKDRWKLRSVTYQGIANAMAEQWG
jgi:hypothetical protein